MTYEKILFGMYKGEPLSWLVVAKQGTGKLLVSEKIVDCNVFNTTRNSASWKDSSLRHWLQNDFFNEAFSAEEKERITPITNLEDGNLKHNIPSGSEVVDTVSILTASNVRKFFSNDIARKCEVTDYAKMKGVSCYKNSMYGQCWTRTPAGVESCLVYVSPSGKLIDKNMPVDWSGVGVRPMIFIDGEDNYDNREEVKAEDGGKAIELSEILEGNEIPKKVKREFKNFVANPKVKFIEECLKQLSQERAANGGSATEETSLKVFKALFDALNYNAELWTALKFSSDQWKNVLKDVCTRADFNPFEYSGDFVYGYLDDEHHGLPLFTNPMAAENYYDEMEMCMTTHLLFRLLLQGDFFEDEKFVGFMISDGENECLINKELRDALIDALESKSDKDEKKNEDCGVDKDGMVCDKCHKVYAANFKFCPECASPLHPIVDDSKCANCGYEFKEGMKFCPKCGTKRGCLPK